MGVLESVEVQIVRIELDANLVFVTPHRIHETSCCDPFVATVSREDEYLHKAPV